MSTRSFRNQATADINNGTSSKAAPKLLPGFLHQKAQIKLARLNAATSLDDLRTLRGNRLEALVGDRQGEYSIRINEQCRVCFRWEAQTAVDVEIVDYH